MATATNQHLSLHDAAEMLSVSVATLRNWDAAGKLQAVRHPINNYRLYKISDVQNLLLLERESKIKSVDVVQPPPKETDSVRKLVRFMSKAFRDSKVSGIMDRFDEISKLIYCKIYDEGHTGKSFKFDSNETDQHVYTRVKELFETAAREYPDVFVEQRAKLSSDVAAITRVARYLSEYELSKMSEDVKGRAYEEIIKNTFEKDENQQFFTPRTIVDFMVAIVDPKPRQYVCDPACGTGGFLTRSLVYVSQKDRSVQGNLLQPYAEQYIRGVEIDSRMAWVSQMNLLMHGGDYNSIHYVADGGSLGDSSKVRSALPESHFDVILTNPPFGSDYTDKESLHQFETGKNKTSRRRGVLFVEKCIRSLKNGGRLGIILDDGVLNGTANQDVRELILRETDVEAAISLPDTAFMPYASVKASILFLRKKVTGTPGRTTFMAFVENTGFRPNGDPLYLDERGPDGKLVLASDFPGLVSAWRNYLNQGRIETTNDLMVFEVDSKTITNKKLNPEVRLDVQFFHPSRETSAALLSGSKYPVVHLAEIVNVHNKMIVPKAEFPDDVIRYVGLANIKSDGSFFVSKVLGEKVKSAVRVFEPNTILFSKLRPELRKVVFVPEEEEEAYVSTECIVLKPSPGVDAEYLTMMLRSDLTYGQLVFQITGVGRPRVSRSALLSVRIPLPPLETQKQLVHQHHASMKSSRILRKKSEEMAHQAEKLAEQAYSEIQSMLVR